MPLIHLYNKTINNTYDLYRSRRNLKCFMGYETNCLVSFFLYFTGKSYRKKSVVFLCSILTNSKKIVLYKYKVKTLY